MHSFTAPAIALAAVAAIPAVSAHGYVSGIVSGGKYYAGANPSWIYEDSPQSVGWFAMNQDNGFVAPDAYSSEDITCHKEAKNGNLYVEAKAGDTIDLQWNTWPDSHHGPVINYLARCNGDCTKVDKANLHFFKAEEAGLISSDASGGTWATDKLIANNFTGTFTIPSNIQGNFVLRHEIIALHSAGTEDGAQNYPQCINLKVTGSGTEHPCIAGADCRAGTALYKEDDPGILINIYTTLSSYAIPGPKIFSGLSKRALRFFA